MVDLFGVFLSVFAAVFFGTYFVPLKKIKDVNLYHYQFFAGISALLVGIVATFVLNIPFQVNPIGIIPGVMWAIANLLAANSLKYVGLSKVPISLGTIVIVSFLSGFLILQESFQSVLIAIVGILLLILGMPLVAIGGNKTRNLLKGATLLVLAGILWGTMFAVPLLFKLEVNSIILPMMIGVFLFGVISSLMRIGKFNVEAAYKSLFSGAIWAVGNVFNIVSLGIIGLALSGPITQLAILVNICWGLFYFKEVKSKSGMGKIIIGGVMLVMGAVLLAFSK